MPTRPKCRTYEELVAGYYGRPSASASRTIDDVVREYYGRPRTAMPAQLLSLSHDDGETLRRRRRLAAEHIVFGASVDEATEEYVVIATPEPIVSHPVDEVIPPEPSMPVAETPVAAAPVPAPAPVPVSEPPAPPAAATEPAPPAPSQSASIDEQDLAADMQAILSGQKVFDPTCGRTVARDEARAPERREPPPPPPQPAGEQEIFERIAQSMRYANAYDLGSVELENRFADFDRMDDLRQRDRAAKRAAAVQPPAPAPAPAPPPTPKVGSADFLEDLDAIGRDVAAPELVVSPAASQSLAAGLCHCGPTAPNLGFAGTAPGMAESLFDTGEHVRAGGNHYVNQLHVGRAPGVAFSYGELISMGDFYATASDLRQAPMAELTALKDLIQKNTRYYVGGKRDDSLDISHGQWDQATGGRYRRLAEENYEHFAPDTLFGTTGLPHGNHRTQWERYHRDAIAEAQRLPASTGSSIPESALVINAFADHFLTDAFASGHLVNKDVVIQRFRATFFSGNSLTPAAGGFFGRLATAAFVGDVAHKFSGLELARREASMLGVKWNINSADRFRRLLVRIAEAEPDYVANLALKALHDHLNKHGIEVANGAGDGPWQLTGDGYLNAATLQVMTKAVDQSIANINDPAIRGANFDVGPFLERVWRITPQLTPASQTEVKRLVGEFTNPGSALLVTAAAEVITKQVDYMIKVLVDERHELQRDS